MLAVPSLHRLLFALTLVSAFGCASDEKQCQRVCEWESRCVSGAVGVEDCASQCINDTESRSADCQDAFDQFASCAARNESCPSVDQQCGGDASRVIEKCDCTNATGVMAELCGN
jgi:hypothetical protein